MTLTFIAVDGKVINLNHVAIIEDQGTETEPTAVVTMAYGDEIVLEGEDATRLFNQMDIIVQVNEAAVAHCIAQAAASQGAQP